MIDEMIEPKLIAHALSIQQKAVYERIWARNLRRSFLTTKERIELIGKRKGVAT